MRVNSVVQLMLLGAENVCLKTRRIFFISLQPGGHYMYRQWLLYVPPVVTVCTASGHYMYRQFNIQQFYVLPTQCIYVFGVDLRTNSDYFPIQH
jgi:hypothetical protein